MVVMLILRNPSGEMPLRVAEPHLVIEAIGVPNGVGARVNRSILQDLGVMPIHETFNTE